MEDNHARSKVWMLVTAILVWDAWYEGNVERVEKKPSIWIGQTRPVSFPIQRIHRLFRLSAWLSRAHFSLKSSLLSGAVALPWDSRHLL